MSLFSTKWTEIESIPDAEGFAGSYGGTNKGILIACGGTNFPDPEKPMWNGGKKTWTDSIFTLSTPESSWCEAGKLPFPYAYGASVTLSQGLLCIGGCDASGHRTNVWLISIDGGKAVVLDYPSLPAPLAYSAAAVLEGKVYLLGGCRQPGEQDCTDEFLVLDPSEKEKGWQPLPPIPSRGRFLHQMAAYNGKIYVLGGIGLIPQDDKMARQLLTEAWSYSPSTGWERLPDLPHPVAAAPTPAPVSRDGSIFLLGGDDGTYAGFTPPWDHPGFHNQTLCFHVPTSMWHDAGLCADPGAVLPCVTWDNRAIMINGERKPGKRSNRVWSVSLESPESLS